jgi:hypothetical protein
MSENQEPRLVCARHQTVTVGPNGHCDECLKDDEAGHPDSPNWLFVPMWWGQARGRVRADEVECVIVEK